MNPNHQLRKEREQRGWSQQKVAEMVGTTARTISRWELGLSRPYPYFREQLCTLFKKNASELGLLIHDESALVAPGKSGQPSGRSISIEEGANGAAEQSPDIYDPAIPPLLAGYGVLVGREKLLEQIRQQLKTGERIAITALNGLPGVGKTALAIALATDPAIKARFRDGILWAGLGPNADVQGLLRHWGLLLGLTPEDMMQLHDMRAWALALRRAIGQRQMLLIIDDVWKLEEALALQIGGPFCSYVITTRLTSLAAQLASDEVVVVPELSEEDGIALLNRFIPEIVTQEPETARELVNLVGGLPLAQVLIGRYLHIQATSKQPRRLQRAVEQLRSLEHRLRLAIPVLAIAQPSNTGPSWSLQAAIAVSDQQLDPLARKALRALSVFPAKPNRFSEEAALVVSQVPVEVLDSLSDSGLLESLGHDNYTLHQTIADYARTQLDDQGAYENLVDYYIDYVEENWENFSVLAIENTNIVAALETAYQRKMQEKYVRLFSAFSRLFLRLGQIDVYERHVQRAHEAAQSVADVDGMMRVLFHLANLQDKRGEYEKGEENVQRALDLARQYAPDHPMLGLTYAAGCRLALSMCDYKLAEERAQIALRLGLQSQDRLITHLAYAALAWTAGCVGKYQELEYYAQEILTRARQDNSQEFLCFGLLFLGQKKISEGAYGEAHEYAQECLDCANSINYDEFACQALELLSQSERLQGKYQQAHEHAEEGLVRAQKNNIVRLTATMQIVLGEALLAWKRIEEAEAVFREAQRTTPETLMRLHAMALYGLARVEAAKGNLLAARECGQASLKLLTDIGHYARKDVKDFIERILKSSNSEECCL